MSTVTFAAPVTRPRRSSHTADAVLAAAVDLARAAAIDAAGEGEVGDHLGARAEDQRLVTHYFASTARGYVGWHWAVTVARPPRARTGTVCEVALLPGDGAITAPAWVPWSERLKPSDIRPDDVLPYLEDDPRLEQGFEATGDLDVDRLAIDELGLGRVRVLSRLGRDEAATRWYTGDRGPAAVATRSSGRGDRRPKARALAPQCATCGFLLLMAGSMRTMFGVCSNEWSLDDGRVVSLDHGCGAHSESDVAEAPSDWPAPAPLVDDLGIEFIHHNEPVAVVEVPVAEAEVVEVPVAEAEVVEVPVAEAEVVDEPTADVPAVDEPTADVPAVDEPEADVVAVADPEASHVED